MKLRVLGEETIENIKFTGIEGGFGENKKAILVKDIAKIHKQPLKEINRRINDNRKRFKDNVDVIDFLSGSVPLRKFAQENGLIGSNRTKHVYLLSERGYAKLLKILDDDKAWEVYDILVDQYFNMRAKLRTLRTFREPDSYMIDDPIQRAERWIEERKAYEKLLPKAKYYDEQMHNPGLMTTTEISKDFGWSAMKLNKFLAAKKIIYRQGKHWVLYQEYANKGYGQFEAFPFKKDGHQGVHNNLKWTQKGRKFIYDLLAKDNIHPVLEEMESNELLMEG